MNRSRPRARASAAPADAADAQLDPAADAEIAAGTPADSGAAADGGRRTARRLAPSERRRQILDAACRLLDTRAIDEVSVESVAEHVRVSPGLLFHYFGTQRRFRQAVAQAAAHELLDQIKPDARLSPSEQLHAAIDTFTEYVARSPGRYLAVVRFTSANREMRNLHDTIRTVMADWLLEGLTASGVPAHQPVRATVAGWLAFVEEALLTWLDDPQSSREELVALCERACYLLVESAVADPERWPQYEKTMRTRPGAAPA